MMSKELLKKAGILGVTFGLVASPFAFAQDPADPADNISPKEQPVDPEGSTSDSSEYEKDDLQHDVGDDASDAEPMSEGGSSDPDLDPEDVREMNDGS